jgi:hypothetical protein
MRKPRADLTEDFYGGVPAAIVCEYVPHLNASYPSAATNPRDTLHERARVRGYATLK